PAREADPARGAGARRQPAAPGAPRRARGDPRDLREPRGELGRLRDVREADRRRRAARALAVPPPEGGAADHRLEAGDGGAGGGGLSEEAGGRAAVPGSVGRADGAQGVARRTHWFGEPSSLKSFWNSTTHRSQIRASFRLIMRLMPSSGVLPQKL